MSAPKGNKYWQFRNKHGRDHKYTPEGLWDEFIAYANWLEENPLKEAVLVPRGIKKKENNQEKTIYQIGMPRMRAMTVTGFCVFADINYQTFENYKKIQGFFEVLTRIEDIIRTQKFEGASAGLLNPVIIARDLGLTDKQAIDHTSKGQAIDLSTYTPEEKALLLSIARKGKTD